MGIVRSFPLQELSLEEIIINWFGHVDIIITEGYKQSKIPKFEVFRKENNKPPVCFEKEELIAVITSDKINIDKPVFDLNDVESVANKMIEISDFSKPEIIIEGNQNKLLENAILNIAKGNSMLFGSKKITIKITE
jgi:hypothetical protein